MPFPCPIFSGVIHLRKCSLIGMECDSLLKSPAAVIRVCHKKSTIFVVDFFFYVDNLRYVRYKISPALIRLPSGNGFGVVGRVVFCSCGVVGGWFLCGYNYDGGWNLPSFYLRYEYKFDGVICILFYLF